MVRKLTAYLWGNDAKYRYLYLTAGILLFLFLDGRDIWTQENRWAEIVSGMFYRHDFFHPYLGIQEYYDKPLLSYWLIVCCVKLFGFFSDWTLRLPTALSGLLAVFATSAIGRTIKNKSCGLLAAWLLLSTYYFVFWARVSSADMLNLAGTCGAIAWYISHRESRHFFSYLVFFVILALTSLCKGLIGAVIPIIAVFIDIVLEKRVRFHFNCKFVAAFVIGLIIYLSPFIASQFFTETTNQHNGLWLVYRENILRYFQPFDHRGPVYTYLIYLPVYLLPTALFLFIPALCANILNFYQLPRHVKWLMLSFFALFLFLTLSGSRRSYYVLPLVPFALLIAADWWTDQVDKLKDHVTKGILIGLIATLLAAVIAPTIYYQQFTVKRFSSTLIQEAQKMRPWDHWNVVLLDAETKLSFYLKLPPTVINYSVAKDRDMQNDKTLQEMWPHIYATSDLIVVSRLRYLKYIQSKLPHHQLFIMPTNHYFAFLNSEGNKDVPIAFIPKS